jgi:2-succinyl-5-enolpyruvyl-6-hydroxy-3-cyclohexene-1-carboxylate synthase
VAAACTAPFTVVVSPGSRSTPLVLAFEACADAEVVAVLDERAAGFFALGQARARRQPALLLCTSGSAAAHYLPAVIEAFYSHTPLLVLSADRPAELHHCGAPQSIDQVRLFGSHCRFFADLGAPHPSSPAAWQALVAQALDAAVGPPAGPVHLNVAFREPLWEPGVTVPEALLPGPPVRMLRSPPGAAASVVAQLAQSFAGKRRCVVVCGPQPACARTAVAIAALAAHCGWPLLAEPAANVAEAAATAVRCADALLRDPDFAAAQAPDAVLRFGSAPTSKSIGAWLQRFGAGKTVLVSPRATYSDPTHGLKSLVVGDVAALCAGLQAALPAAAAGRAVPVLCAGLQAALRMPDSATPRATSNLAAQASYLAAWQAADAQASQTLRRFCGETFFAGSVVRQVCAALPPSAALLVANSMAIRDLDSFAGPLPAGVEVFSSRGANGIDGTLATLLGVAAASVAQRRPVVGLLGDLAFLHDVGSLQLARQLQVPALAVVLNNAGGAIFDRLPIHRHPTAYHRLFRTPQQADIAALCAATQVGYGCARSAAQLQEALSHALQALTQPGCGLHVVEVFLPEAAAFAGADVYEAAWAAVGSAVDYQR